MVRKIQETQEFITTMFVVRQLINEEIVPIFEYVYYNDVHTERVTLRKSRNNRNEKNREN